MPIMLWRVSSVNFFLSVVPLSLDETRHNWKTNEKLVKNTTFCAQQNAFPAFNEPDDYLILFAFLPVADALSKLVKQAGNYAPCRD
jgi:hypothetical protein